MNKRILLVKPTKDYKFDALEYRREHFEFDEKIINGSELLDKIEDYDEWLAKVEQNANEETVDKNWVLTDTFFAIRKKDKKIIGIIDLRYRLNDFLKDFGHCGYSVRPSERNKGYATEMLSLICKLAKKAGLNTLQLSVEKENISSIKTITKNGGIYQRSFEFEGNVADVYSISL